MRCSRKASVSATHVAVEVGILQALARGGGGVHHDQRGAGLRADLGERRDRAGR